jgi:nitroreductase
MTMFATSHAARGESAPRPHQSIVTDQGGLVVEKTLRLTSTPHQMRGQAPGQVPSQRQDVGCGAERPGAVLTPDALAAVIGTAARAPSVHNTQPWKFRVDGDVIELHADHDRLLAQIDPAGRELVISCGAALFGLRLGLRQLSRVPAVQLWPDPAQPSLVARVWPDANAAMNAIEAELLAAVPHRHTHRGPFTPGEVSPRLLAALAVDAMAEGAELKFVESPGLVSELAVLVDQAAAEQDASADISAEMRRWLRPAGSEARDGVPERAAAIGSDAVAPRFRQRKFGAPADARDRSAGALAGEDVASEPPAATAVLLTEGDTADDWLRAGQALNRLLLRAATRWVFASLQSQPMESPRHREQVRHLLALPGQPQMLLQFGRANTAPATPRRPQAEYRTNEKWH